MMVIGHINKQFCSTSKCWLYLKQNKVKLQGTVDFISNRPYLQFCHINEYFHLSYKTCMFQHRPNCMIGLRPSRRRCCTYFSSSRFLSTDSCNYKIQPQENAEINVTQKSMSKSEQLGITRNSKYPELSKLFALALPEKKSLAGGIAFLIVSSSITMAVPFALGHIIDVIYTLDPIEMKKNLNKVCLALVGIFVTGSMANFGRIYLMNMAGQRITKALRSLVFASIMKQETAFFDTNKTGELVNRLSSDATIVSQAVTMNISDGLRSTVMVIAGIGMMFYMSSELAIVGLSIVPPTALMAKYYGKYLQKITLQVQDTLAASTQVAEEKISNIRTVRAFAQEFKEIKEYDKNVNNVLKLTHKESLARGIYFALTGLSGNVVVLSVLYYGGTLVTESSLTVGQLTSFLLYAAYVGLSLGGLSSFYSELNKGIGASSRLFQLMERVPSMATHSGKTLPYDVVKGKLAFRGVHFAYPTRSDYNILNNFNLEVPSGSIIAVVGASGSGKSTLGALLLRLYDPLYGDILLDDQPIQDLDPTWLRSLIASVSQEPTLFSTTILENILYGCPDPSTISHDDITKAAKEANALSFIEEFPDRFNTLVGERGVLLSGGQKQRIAIARAIISKPKILLLDEATSALDAESESLVQEALERLMKNKTVITIAHRLSTIRNASQIAVLHQGSIAELGSYSDLLQLEDGIFRKLVEKQTITR